MDGASVYGYALQNPGRYVDPRGEFVWLLPIVAGILLDAYVDELKKHCSCDDDDGYKYTILGATWSATGAFVGGKVGGVAGGGRSGDRTSNFSMLIHKISGGTPGPRRIWKHLRNGGRFVAKKAVPILGVGFVLSDLYSLRDCLYRVDANEET